MLVLTGEFDRAAELMTEELAITQAAGIPHLPNARLILAAWRGREAETTELHETLVQEATERGEGATRKSPALAANEICTSLAVVALAVLSWILGGWIPSRSDFVPSLLLALAIGFTSTAAVIMSVFDAESMPAVAPEPTMEAVDDGFG
ncbi:hypothetical protein [Actinomadura sp. 6K520]|uniref:hypothetical protein n=1 Tax=Actinomadura sp. 6K520 TaxID=2530364 RepID=UPI0010489A27|nr:hypothetical protein [Actinomadura sp. 6K520]TDE37658.1 hypothetical protein E1289_03670 [Actinomadura sp. 6K520]